MFLFSCRLFGEILHSGRISYFRISFFYYIRFFVFSRGLISGIESPLLPQSNKKSSIVVGVFDGGVDSSHSLLVGYVKDNSSVTTPPDADYVEHGSSVCGTVLHGNLAGKTKADMLPVPHTSIESYRVLPQSDLTDFELYEAIDAIEATVNSRMDIKLYNLSLGPDGAIIDDSISRFTYVLDKLTYDPQDDDVNPLFCVACGNDGDLASPLNRIQSPADMVNGIGVGAYTYHTDGSKIRTSYSCIGSGREGAKVKPDVLEFGGSPDRPFIVIGPQSNSLVGTCGTSFATPLVTHKIGKLMAQSENITPHLGRTLIVHHADVDDQLSREEQGYGYSKESIDDTLTCLDKFVTVLYSGKLVPSETVHLPIFAPRINDVKGMVNISWTITTIVAPYANDPDAYTNNCIADTFIPHAMTYNFSKRNSAGKVVKVKKLNLLKNEDVAQVQDLLNQGYVQSTFPVSKSSKHSWNESDLRASELKWDTVIRKNIRMRGSSLINPALTLQAIDRNGFNASHIKYHVAVSIDAPKYVGSLYDAVLQTYQNLAPIELRNINRIMVDNIQSS